jgi:hypothetical protein
MRNAIVLLSLVLVYMSVSAQTKTTKQKAPAPVVPPTSGAVISPTTPLPDFVISSYRFDQSGQNVTAYVTLLNSGNAGASFQTDQTMAVLLLRGSSYTCKAFGGGSYVDRGKTVELSRIVPSVPPGTYSATWTANPDKVVFERSYTNNMLECQLVVSSQPPPPPVPLPDLVISGLTVQPTSGPPNTIFEFRITVTNQGDAAAIGGAWELCQTLLDGTPAWNKQVQWAPYKNLSPGESIVHIVRTVEPLALGTHEFKATVDDRKALTEKNENNNSATVQFIVK